MSQRPWRVLVVVPAHDEEALLHRCLWSLQVAARRVAEGGDWCHVVVVADSCTDSTVALAGAMLDGWGQVLQVDVRNVGRARALGVLHGLGVLGRLDRTPPRQIWLANTDADSAVPPDWLECQLAWADRGMAGVAGIVRVDSFAEHPLGLAERFAERYRVGPVSHGHVHGANLGIRADAYLAVAGWPGAGLSEDHALWDRLRAGGWPVVADSGLWVTTSGRRVGRAAGGFADTLAALAAAAPTADGTAERDGDGGAAAAAAAGPCGGSR